MTEESVIFINDTELKESDMSDQQKYFARQVQDLTNKKSRVEFELDQILASLKVFQNALVDTTKEIANEILETKKKESK